MSNDILNEIMNTDYSKKRYSRTRSIRLKCLDCCGGSYTFVKECDIKTCPLWRYRMGNEKKGLNEVK